MGDNRNRNYDYPNLRKRRGYDRYSPFKQNNLREHNNYNNGRDSYNAYRRYGGDYHGEFQRFPRPVEIGYSNYDKSNHSIDINDQTNTETTAELLLSPLERKAKDFLDAVLKQNGIRSKLIFLETVNMAVQTLQGTVDYCQLKMDVIALGNGDFTLRINDEEVATGTFINKQAAKNILAQQALEELRKDCFYIVKKKSYEEITKQDTSSVAKPAEQAPSTDNKAYQMMLKMGWGGKGLGVNEQGTQELLAEVLDENITREGLGSTNVFKKVDKILQDFANSRKISLLKFDPDFTSEERAHIHKIASKYGLKSKSEGKGTDRRITVTKKLHRADLVFNLLVNELENNLYKLHIPSNFLHIWEA